VIGLEELATDTCADPPAASDARAPALWACGQAGFIPRVAFGSDEYTPVVEPSPPASRSRSSRRWPCP
jgi:hypothetical protein